MGEGWGERQFPSSILHPQSPSLVAAQAALRSSVVCALRHLGIFAVKQASGVNKIFALSD